MRKINFLCGLFFIALLVRTVVFYGYLRHDERYWQVDSYTYHQVATQLSQGNGIVNADGSSHFYRVPGYPVFLAMCYKVFGFSKVAALWVQVVLASCIPLLIYFLSLSLFPGHLLLAQCCSIVSAFHFGLVLYAGFFMTETLFIFFFLLFLVFFFRARNRFSTHSYVGTFAVGSFLGLASLVRPVGHYLIVVSVLVLLLLRSTWSERLIKSGILTGSWLLVVSIWLIRNYLLTGVLFFHTLPGGHFLYLSAARVVAQVHGVEYQQARNMLEKQVRATIDDREAQLGHQIPEIEACVIHEKLATTYFCMHPFVTLKYWCTDMFRAAFSLYSAELLFLASGRKLVDYFSKEHGLYGMFKRYLSPETDSWWLRMLVYVEITFFALMLVGFLGFVLGGVKRWYVLMSVLPFIAIFIVIALSGGYARMRLPIEPLLMILSGAWFLALIKK